METTTQEIINYIATAPKLTKAKAYANGNVANTYEGVNVYNGENSVTLIGDLEIIRTIIENENLTNVELEVTNRNSGVELSNEQYDQFNARIEPGAVIRTNVEIGDNAVIMMGAVINIGAKIGSRTMIDMNAVLGGRANIGENCHIGAGAVVAGVIEPASATPCVIEDNVLIGANSVILEGVRVGANAVVGAGSIVTKDVPANCVVVGNPARVVKEVDQSVKDKTAIVEDLR